jgi:hypothetical protein
MYHHHEYYSIVVDVLVDQLEGLYHVQKQEQDAFEWILLAQ